MTPATLPIDVKDRPLATLKLSRGELTRRFGNGVVPDVEMFTFPGSIHVWPLRLDDGQRVLLMHHIEKDLTELYANPEDVDRALRGIGVASTLVTWRREVLG